MSVGKQAVRASMRGSESDDSFRDALNDGSGLITDELPIECQICFVCMAGRTGGPITGFSASRCGISIATEFASYPRNWYVVDFEYRRRWHGKWLLR